MKTSQKSDKKKSKNKFNPVAKHAGKFNKSLVHKDRSKYARKNKHQSSWEKS